MDKNLPERPHHGQDSSLGGTTHSQYDHSPQNKAIGGGVYNSVTGAGSEQNPQHRINHPTDTRQSHNPLSSGTTGSTGGNYGQRNDAYEPNAPSSRNEHSGHGLAGAGAVGAGGVGAGVLANKHHNDNTNRYDDYQSSNRDNNQYSGNAAPHNASNSHHTQGVPRSSMLDVDELGGTGQTAGQTSHLGGATSQDGISRGQVHGHGMIPSSGIHGQQNSSTTGTTGAPGYVSERDQLASAALQGDHSHSHRGQNTSSGFGSGQNTGSNYDNNNQGSGYGSSGLQHTGREGISHGQGHTYEPGVNAGSNYDSTSGNNPSSGFNSAGGHNLGQGTQAPGYSHGQDQNLGSRNSGSGFGSSSSPTSASGFNSGGGLGKDHFGPAHEGAKVMHKCECGRDNDISHYFQKDAVYRIGS